MSQNIRNHLPSRIPAYASFDVETDGNNPMQHSMRSIGIALFVDSHHKDIGVLTVPVDTFYATLKPLPDAKVEESCMRDFWEVYPEMWLQVNKNPQDPIEVMKNLSNWLSDHSRKYCIKWVANPANFDWMFLKCYYEKFGPMKNKFNIGFFCHDLSSLIRAFMVMNNIRDKKKFLLTLSENHTQTHNALDDAICQGVTYINLRRCLNKCRQRTKN
jgi:hypothetical protein